MSTSTLSAHSPRFHSKLTTLAGLRQLPEPTPMGPLHKPVHHARLVDGILAEIQKRNYTVRREQYALGAKGAALFGVIDLEPAQLNALVANPERGVSFGFRSSTNQEMAIKAVAGSHVFVCDNLSLSGDMIAFMRKSTLGLDLADVIGVGFDKFIQQTQVLEIKIQQLMVQGISDGEAKQRIFDVFNAGIMPVRLFDDVARFYFKPADEMTDCTPRTQWGLHNAFTRAARDMSAVRRFETTVQLGRVFDLSGDVIDAETV